MSNKEQPLMQLEYAREWSFVLVWWGTTIYVWGYRQHNVNVAMQWIKGKWGVEESTINPLNKRLAFIYNLCVWVDPTTIKDKRTRVIAHGKLDVVPSPKFSWATASSSGSTSNYVGSRHLWRLKWRFCGWQELRSTPITIRVLFEGEGKRLCQIVIEELEKIGVRWCQPQPPCWKNMNWENFHQKIFSTTSPEDKFDFAMTNYSNFGQFLCWLKRA